jgi:gliding motility-associated-like protein
VISKLPITITASTNTKVYDGTISATATPTLTGTLASGDVGTYSETYDTKNQGAGKTLTPTGAILDATNASMTGNYSITYVTNTNGVISKLPITITASTNTKVYDGTISATATPTLTGTLASGDVGVYSETYDTKSQGTNKTLTPTGVILDATNTSMTGNYSITYASVNTGIIAKKPITITATAGQTKVYGGSDPTSYAYTLSTALVGSDVLTGALTRAAGETVGPYAISQGTLTNANYDIAFVANNFTITKKPITITATAGQTKVYGGSDPTSYAYSLNTPLIGSDFLTGALARVAGEIVGPYAISQGTLANTNYDIAFVGSDFSITKAPLTITAKPHTITYNGTAYAGGNGVEPTGLAAGETISNLTGTLIYTGTSQGAKNVDSYTIIPDGLSSPNYNINYVGGTLEIKKATLKVIAGDQSVNFGTPAAKILTDATFNYASLLGGDNASAITGSVTFSTNYTPLTSTGASGIYLEPIITGLSNSNYDIVAVKGNITITAPPSSPVFQIPNAFTPNSDGHNDTFKIIQNGYVTSIISFRVFTKSGKLIFSDKDGAWDGRYAGVMLDADVYIWIADFINNNNGTEHLSGTVLLLK